MTLERNLELKNDIEAKIRTRAVYYRPWNLTAVVGKRTVNLVLLCGIIERLVTTRSWLQDRIYNVFLFTSFESPNGAEISNTVNNSNKEVVKKINARSIVLTRTAPPVARSTRRFCWELTRSRKMPERVFLPSILHTFKMSRKANVSRFHADGLFR